MVRPHGANDKKCKRHPQRANMLAQCGTIMLAPQRVLHIPGWILVGPRLAPHGTTIYVALTVHITGWILAGPLLAPHAASMSPSLYDLRTHYRSKVTTITLSGHTQITHYFQLKLVNIGSCKCDWRVEVSTGTYNRSIMHMFSSGKSTVNVAFNVVHTGAITKLCFGNIWTKIICSYI